jgi:hypothetical protein
MSGGMIAPNVSGKASIVLTTKGDVATYDTARTRLAVGSNDQILTSDSTVSKGVAWKTPSSHIDSPWTQNHDFDAYYYDMQTISAPSSPSTDNGRVYVKQIDSNNDGIFIKIKKSGGFVEVQLA